MKFSLRIALGILGLLFCALPTTHAAEDVPPQLFRAGEVHLDAFGSAKTSDMVNVRGGYGAGAAWYPWRTAGFRGEVITENPQHASIDQVGLTLVARLPFESVRLALDYGVGASAYFDGNPYTDRGDFSIHAELGPRVRLHRNWDLWLRVRGVRPATTSTGEHLQVLLGTSVAF